MEELKVKSLAKINLGLNVVSKRDDGYHNIETIFYPIGLHDVLTFKKANGFKFATNNEDLNSSSDNLIIKAKELLEIETKKELNVHIRLEKKIPIGAGLGGGSSNAAIALKTLNNIFNLNVNDKLASLALRLGSDVPLFLDLKTSYASSRGEKLEERYLKIKYPLLIVNPGIHISTKWAYSNITTATPAFNLKDLTQEDLDAPEKLASKIKNDFENIVLNEYPEIKKLSDNLREMKGSLFTSMTGSGSTFFSIFNNHKSAEKAKLVFEERYFVYLESNEN